MRFISNESEAMVHGYQKALYGTKSVNSILDQVEGLDHHEVDSGCCGMAESFEYE